MSPLRPALLLALSLSLLPAAAQAQTPAPLTGFEQRIAAAPGASDQEVAWTTPEEEAEFLATVDGASDRLVVEEIGRTSEGRPLRLARLGVPTPRSVDESADGQAVLVLCSQHGDEPAGREGCLQQIRRLALSDEPGVVDHLTTTSVMFLPTANPDGRVANTRVNAQGIDVNRDHLDSITPEAQAIDGLLRDLRPDVVADMHEYDSRPLYDTELLYLWPRNRNVDSAVAALSRTLAGDYVRAGAEAGGFSAGVYGISVLDGREVAQDAGDGDERILRNAVGLRHSVGLLVETDERPNRRNPEEATSVPAVQARRAATHVRALDDVLRFQRENAAAVEDATEAAPVRAAAEGARADEPFYLDGADNVLPPIAQVLYPPPCAYDVTAEQAARLAGVFGLHEIETVVRGGDVRVSMAQAAQPRIPLLLDPGARFSPVDGRRVTSCEAG